MKINKDILKVCSKNLLIEFNNEEENFLFSELETAINFLEKVKNINLDNVEPTDFSIKAPHKFRDDDVSHEDNEYIKKQKDYSQWYIKV